MATLSVVDVETTGLKAGDDRIIEIGIIRVEDDRVVERYQRLINPERPLPYFIQQHTGITDEMVAQEPTFTEILSEIKPLLTGSVFVAHNAGFDYSFVKSEYHREGEVYFAPRLCTVQLSRKLFPSHRRHNLDAIMERFSIPCPARHRALDDAEVVWQFLQQLRMNMSNEEFRAILAV